MITLWIAAGLLLLMIALAFVQAKIYAKAGSIYFRRGAEEKLMAEYDRQLKAFTVPYETHRVQTRYGEVHVIECGNESGKPLILFHAASVGAVSWRNNVQTLGQAHHLYLIDTLGEGNRSALTDVEVYPKNGQEVAELYRDVTQALGVERASIAGASYGGFICLLYALHYPDKVEKIILSGSMGIAKSVMKVILKLTFYSFYPYRIFRKPMAHWAFGNGQGLADAKAYFDIVLEGVLGRYYAPKTLLQEELAKIQPPVLLVLGSRDSLVGDPGKAHAYAAGIPRLTVQCLDSGHLINVEKSDDFDRLALEFLERK